MEDVSLAGMKGHCLEFFNLNKQKKDLENQISQIQESIDKKKAILKEFLESNQLENFDSGMGKVYLHTTTSWKCSDPHAFYDWAEKEGIHKDILRVNFQTLNALMREKLEKSIEASNETLAQVPGVDGPNMFTDVRSRGAK